jgi:hypothetical protein
VARIVPSQIVQFIDQHLPAVRENAARDPNFAFHAGTHGAALRTLAGLLAALPDELVIVPPDENADYQFAVRTLRDVLVRWESNTSIGFGRPPTLKEHPVGVIRRVLADCPDEPLAPATKLAFVAETEPDLADALRHDLGAVDRALANAEWKAATVLAGSVIEALLLWALQQAEQAALVDDSKVAAKLRDRASKLGGTATTPSGSLEYGHLNNYLAIIEDIGGVKDIGGIIKPDTFALADTARNFRNLIHPGRAQRTAAQCDRGTALAAVAALEHVIRDLTSGVAATGS